MCVCFFFRGGGGGELFKKGIIHSKFYIWALELHKPTHQLIIWALELPKGSSSDLPLSLPLLGSWKEPLKVAETGEGTAFFPL